MAPTQALASIMIMMMPTVYAANYTAEMADYVPHTCGDLKKLYKRVGCCGTPSKPTGMHTIPMPSTMLPGDNLCKDAKVALANTDCMVDTVVAVLEQSGANVTAGYVGGLDVGDRTPITSTYLEAGLCPVNVHWHSGAEHLSMGEYDEAGHGPGAAIGGMTGEGFSDGHSRRLGANVRQGLRCHHYDNSNPKFTTEYEWLHCKHMHVGETYEIHWPHSAAGACGTPNQWQTPFYDGVFCLGLAKLGVGTGNNPNASLGEMVQGQDGSPALSSKVGVQAQVFTIINDENYFYPDLMRGMIIDGEYGMDIAKYTGSTTGTTRNNQICSSYSPITWQVDRKCHLISASSFDKMCADMKTQRDDMSGDMYPHGSREVVANSLAANNPHRL